MAMTIAVMTVRSAALAYIRHADITACKVRLFMTRLMYFISAFYVPLWAPKDVVGKVEMCG